jgi:hypothetical protein
MSQYCTILNTQLKSPGPAELLNSWIGSLALHKWKNGLTHIQALDINDGAGTWVQKAITYQWHSNTINIVCYFSLITHKSEAALIFSSEAAAQNFTATK